MSASSTYLSPTALAEELPNRNDYPFLAAERKRSVKRKLSSLCLCLLTLSALVLPATGARAQTFLVDDFNDGNDVGWTREDTTIGQPWGPATYDATSGAYHLQAAAPIPVDDLNGGLIEATWDASVGNPLFANGFARGMIRADTPGTTLGLGLRVDDEAGTDYGFYGSTGFGTFYIERFDPSLPSPQTILAMADTALFPFALGEDWNLEAGAVGNRLTLKAWRVGQPEPVNPLLTVLDSAFGQPGPTNLCAISFFDGAVVSGPVQVSATFDNITFTAVSASAPEPSSAALAMLGSVLMAVGLARHRKGKKAQ